MSDWRVVQCFGTLVRPGKPARPCRAQFMWIAAGTHGNFGRKGARACPHCGNLPNLAHPINQRLVGDITDEEFNILIEDWNPDGTKKEKL